VHYLRGEALAFCFGIDLVYSQGVSKFLKIGNHLVVALNLDAEDSIIRHSLIHTKVIRNVGGFLKMGVIWLQH
jgi:hypothetical protein